MEKLRKNKSVKLNTKVTQEDYALLLKTCEECGFTSIYQMLQTLLHCFLRHKIPERDEVFDSDSGIGVEIEMMFEELGHPEPDAPTNGRRFPRRQIR